ncbi:MAG: hypothetical protein DHS20C01_21210 [marine bacterium B5-7]|nr:MAG: hypothetical protein DHS20C01_21210 [marine bacterium B5-7]
MPSLPELPVRLSRRLKWLSVALLGCGIVIISLGFYLWKADNPSSLGFISLVVMTGIASVLAFLAADCIVKCLFKPLGRVMYWAGEIRQGNLSARVPDSGDTELVAPVDDINRAAEWLEALALDKERELENRKSDIERKSRSLQLLYDVATGINNATEVDQLTARFLYTLADVVSARGASVRLKDSDGSIRTVAELSLDGALLHVDQVAGSHPALFDLDRDLDIGEVLDVLCNGGADIANELRDLEMIVVRLQYLDQVKGVYLLYIEKSRYAPSDELKELLVSIGRQLGLAVEKARLDFEATLLPRMQERANLANELHDSLAQTLASLRFQVRVLDDTLHQRDEAAVWAEMERIESSLEEANIELRELIRHFRAPVHRRGLIAAISTQVARFRKETGINTFFQNQWEEIDLADEWEVHVQRIVQEALANIRKHSGASNVRVLLSHDDESYRVLVEDDGEGFACHETGEDPGDHFGMSIMAERASIIGADLKVESEVGEGTRVLLRFGGKFAANAGNEPVDTLAMNSSGKAGSN